MLITLDTTRADRIGAYGYPLAHTPNIDRLATEGALFEDALTTAPITAVAHSTLLTGLLPPAHGVRDNGSFILSSEAVTLAEHLKQAGYRTAAFVSAVVLSRRYGMDQGFDVYDDELWSEDEPNLFMIRERSAADTISKVLAWLAPASKRVATDDEDPPFFLWVHLFDPHEPLRPPAWTLPLAPTPYDREITSADREIGRLIEALRASGKLDDTVFVFTADHGESHGQHEEKTHAIFVYQATTHVPLIIRYPHAFPAGARYPMPVGLADVAPTVLALTGLPGSEHMQGADLRALVHAAAADQSRPQYSESKLSELGFGMAPLYAVRKDGFTFIRAPRPELYNLSADPDELNNLYGREDTQLRADGLNVELERMMQDSAARALKSEVDSMSRETMQMLQSLGYLQGAEDRASAEGVDPKDGIRTYNLLAEARHHAQDENWEEAEAACKTILAELPKHYSARSVLALTYFNQRRWKKAHDEYLTLLTQDPSQFRVHLMLGQIELGQGRLAEAAQFAEQALRVSPSFVEAMSMLGLLAEMRDDLDEAEAWYQRGIQTDPGFPTLYRRLGDIRFKLGKLEEALDFYREGYRRNSGDQRSLWQAAASARRLERWDEAEQLLLEAVENDPKRWLPRYNLACLYAAREQHDDALRELEVAIGLGLGAPGLLDEDADWNVLREDARFIALRNQLINAASQHKAEDAAQADSAAGA